MCTVQYAYREMRKNSFLCSLIAHTHILAGSCIYFLLFTLAVITFYCIFYFLLFNNFLACFSSFRVSAQPNDFVSCDWVAYLLVCVVHFYIFVVFFTPFLFFIFTFIVFVRSDVYKCACVNNICLRTELFFIHILGFWLFLSFSILYTLFLIHLCDVDVCIHKMTWPSKNGNKCNHKQAIEIFNAHTFVRHFCTHSTCCFHANMQFNIRADAMQNVLHIFWFNLSNWLSHLEFQRKLLPLPF